MEAAVACHAAPDQGPDVFVNKAPLYKPLWGRGAFGGAVLAQALSAAQATVPAGFVADTMHCHFFLAVKPDEPLYSHVERLRDGKSIATRSVRCMQQQQSRGGKCVFSAMLNFGRTAGRGPRMLQHQPASPVSPATVASIRSGGASVALSSTSRVDADCPFESIRVRRGKQDDDNDDGHQRPELQRIVQMTRAKLPPLTSSSSTTTTTTMTQRTRGLGGDVALHQAALAYMTDNYFLGTVPRVHKAHRFSNKGLVENVVRKLDEGQQEVATDRFKMLAEEELADAEASNRTGKGGAETTKDTSKASSPPKIDMMVSLDHAIFFHNQDEVRADDWMVMEMETPWAGQDRGLVLERIWTADGVLVATCIQEGLFRLSQDAESHL
ncbi:acyl-CoA thioesterase II [Beauveria bassiana ARSEF 2860]|uniref:Acyl-CoA thioesterase II n=1 Tax=Beauveria bassiana (strain ARSEF 2860) TaxID=655819 RepID=J4UIJ6_BEAB2|nr:acyl-CoA thioesterase II [Beauveria bassiana ARSEF 2860]EJP63392.1 acyl-CoA thioesterase II [Beauveria bassiana ARSEF 2860]